MRLMRQFAIPALAALAATTAAAGLPTRALAQQTTTGSVGCTAVTQAAIDGQTSRIGADNDPNSGIKQPQSVKTLTCLGSFFSGVGLDLVTNLLDPASLLQAVEGQICTQLQTIWSTQNAYAHCGLTITGFNLGFGGLGGGLSCPKLSFGGGGPPIGSVGLGGGLTNGPYISGTGLAPTGYTAPNVPPGIL